MKVKKRTNSTSKVPSGFSNEEVVTLFPTTLVRRQMPGSVFKNVRLREIVLEHEKTDPGTSTSNVGGWHSKGDLWDWPEPEIQELCNFVNKTAENLTSTVFPIKKGDEIKVTPYGGAWVNLLRNGAYNKVHNHPGAVWSAVYYVSLGRPDKTIPDNGLIEFMDPRPGNIHGGKEKIEPENGLLIIFPSWLYHYVNPYQGDMERISIAFNMDVEIIRPGFVP